MMAVFFGGVWMALRSVLVCVVGGLGVAGLTGFAQSTAQQVDDPSLAAQAPDSFTSAAQAREYLARNPAGARAEVAFRTVVDADLATRYPDLDPAQIALGLALFIAPGAGETPEQIEAAIAQTTPGIGTSKRSILPF